MPDLSTPLFFFSLDQRLWGDAPGGPANCKYQREAISDRKSDVAENA